MSHIKDRLKQYKDKYSDCYEYSVVVVKVIQDMIEQLLADLEQDKKENGWIPVTERLPEEEGAYIVTFKNGIRVRMAGYGCCRRTVLGYPIGRGWYNLETAQYYTGDSINAWMPLPEPYKED